MNLTDYVNPKFKIGEYVRIKYWHEMLLIGRKDEQCCIEFPDSNYYFLQTMSGMCGNTFKITGFREGGIVLGHNKRCNITTNMIENMHIRKVNS